MENKNKISTGGIGFTGLLQIVFLVLKLTKVIDWSWWWVLSPTWIGASVFVVLIVAVIVFALIAAQLEQNRDGEDYED